MLTVRPDNMHVDPLSQIWTLSVEDKGVPDKSRLISIPENSTASPFSNLEPSTSEFGSPLNANIFQYLLNNNNDSVKKSNYLFSRRSSSHKYSIERKITEIAKQIIPPSTQPTAEQKLKRCIREAWEKRFAPERYNDKLYVSGVLYAKRARFFKTEDDYWRLDDQCFTDHIISHDPLEDYSYNSTRKLSYSIHQLSIYLRRDSVHSQSSMASKQSLDRKKSRSMLSINSDTESVKRSLNERKMSSNGTNNLERRTSFCNFKLPAQRPTQPPQDGLISAIQRDPTTVSKEQNTQQPANAPEKKRRNVSKKVKRFVLPNGGHLQTFERRRTRPDDSMYESIDPMILNKNKLSKAFCETD